MKRMPDVLGACALAGIVASGAWAAPNDPVTQADLKALVERIAKLEAENKAQAARIAELEGQVRAAAPKAAGAAPAVEGGAAPAVEEGTSVSADGRVYTTAQGRSYYLADKVAGIFEPLSESGLKVTPYGYLIMEAVYNTHTSESDYYTDYVRSKRHKSYKGGTTTLSAQDSILGIRMETPEAENGWMFAGKAEFGLTGDHANDYAFRWRHLYIEATHEASGWSILGGQTWHLWKMVAPSEIDCAWMENTGYPYRRSSQFRVTKTWDRADDRLEARVGLVKNGPGMGGDRDGDGTQDNSASHWALFEGAVVYERDAAWDRGRRWLLGLGGMYGRDRSSRRGADGSFTHTYDNYDSQMLMAAFSVPFLEKFTFVGQVFAGENLGGVQAGVGQRVAYYAPDRRGHEVSTIGGFFELKFAPDDVWSFAGGYGFDDPDNSEAKYAKGILHNDRAYIDAFYRVNRNFKIGVEYAHLRTQWYGEGTSHADRVQLSAFYDF